MRFVTLLPLKVAGAVLADAWASPNVVGRVAHRLQHAVVTSTHALMCFGSAAISIRKTGPGDLGLALRTPSVGMGKATRLVIDRSETTASTC